MEKKYKLIAELCCNHQGDINKAKEMIIKAKACGADGVKFQKRTPKLQFTQEKYNAPHPNPENAFGKTYGEHRENLEFSIEQHFELKLFAEEQGLEYSCSIFDIISTKQILSINPKNIKIPSTTNNNIEVLEYIAKNFNGTIHISLGMTTKTEENQIIDILKKYSKLKNTILYHCVSSYPVADRNMSLMEITRLKQSYGDNILAIGYSGHNEGSLADSIALALGATYFERHFTFDKMAKGSDHKISLDYNEMEELTKNLNRTQLFLSYKEKEILDCELNIRRFHKDNH